MMDAEIAAYRSLLRSYASLARWYKITYQNSQALNFHMKALATLAMLQWLISAKAQNGLT